MTDRTYTLAALAVGVLITLGGMVATRDVPPPDAVCNPSRFDCR